MSVNAETLCRRYEAYVGTKTIFLVSAVFMLAAAMVAGICVGASGMGWKQTLTALFENSGRGHSIIWILRMPRVVMAALVGFGMGMSGTVFQAVLRNPLASPFTLGVGSAAGFGAVCALVLFDGGPHSNYVAAGAFSFSLVSAVFILAIAKIKHASYETMLLAGIAQMFLFSSLTSLLQYTGTMQQVYNIVFWFFGSLSKAGWPEIAYASVMILLPFPIFLSQSWDFNLLATGDESARSLGVNTELLRMRGIALASLATAGSICFTGVIGFIGLVAPHITRMVIGNDHRFLLPASGVIGALLVVVADILGRTLWAPRVIPIGIVTSFIGVPFFLYLLLKRSRAYW